MTIEIHPTALVDPKSELDDGVLVQPYAIVEEGTTIGKGSKVEAMQLLREARIGKSPYWALFSSWWVTSASSFKNTIFR